MGPLRYPLPRGSGHLWRLRDGALWGLYVLVPGKPKGKVGIKVIIFQCSLAKEVSLLLRETENVMGEGRNPRKD